MTGDLIDPVLTSLLLVAVAAVASHVGVRYAHGAGRLALLLLAMALLGWAFQPGRALGGFWPGVYALLSAYFLAWIVMPWLDLAVRHLGRLPGAAADKPRAG